MSVLPAKMSWTPSDGTVALATLLGQMPATEATEEEKYSEELNTFCRNAIAAGPVSSGLLLVIMGNTDDKERATLNPLPLDHARVYLTRCGQQRVLFHDTEDRYWDILYRVATRELLSVQPWDGPSPPEPILDTAFCVHSD